MRALHFHALAAGRQHEAEALMKQVDRTLRPLSQFLRQAERTARIRQARYRLPWEPVPERSLTTLRLLAQDRRLLCPRPPRSWLLRGWPTGRAPDLDQPLMVVSRGVNVRLSRAEPCPAGLRIWPVEPLEPQDRVFYCGMDCSLAEEPAAAAPQEVIDNLGRSHRPHRVETQEHHFIVTIDARVQGPFRADGLVLDPLPDLQGLRELREPGDAGRRYPVTGDQLRVAELPSKPVLLGDNGVRYRWRPEGRPSGVWVQLLPPAQSGVDDLMDPRAAFCDDIEAVWTQPRFDPSTTIKVPRVDPDRYQLLLERAPPAGPPEAPPAERRGLLYLPLDLRPLQLQRQALSQLQNGPLPHHRGLLRLTEDPHKARWPRVVGEEPETWFSLTDPERSGTDEQRAFVRKALAAPDFTFLSGPPGSGKTTAICELVQQLVRRGQRVLLCASTHVAIDNVLERLVGHDPEVVALRIGSADKVDERIHGCLLDVRAEQLRQRWRALPALSACGDEELRAMAERTAIAAANLTCGTTLGILRHPLFTRRDGGDDQKPWERPITRLPHWDVLIVDEASKTLFQEFLVPALLCRRWVVVGDVRQLPPFADRMDLVGNLRGLLDERDRPLFSPEQQRAVLLRFRLERLRKTGVRWLLCEQGAVLNAIEQEVAKGDERDRPLVCRFPCPGSSDGLGDLRPAAAEWVLATPAALKTAGQRLPATLLFARRIDRETLPEDAPLRLRQRAWLARAPRLPQPLRDRHREIAKLKELEEHEADWLERNDWASEFAWRLTRLHELLRSRDRSQRERLQRDIECLLPRTVDLREVVGAIQDVSLPSVLEVLEEGTGRERPHPSALSQGLGQSVLGERRVQLTFQHRMHPDISELPRALFYEGAALRDANTIARRDRELGWDFAEDLGARRVWIDIRGQEHGGINELEVRCAEALLRRFLAWAGRKGPPARERPGAWEVACLAFYQKQDAALREMLRRLLDQRDRQTRFSAKHVEIVCGTLDRFQGREADLVLLSLRNTRRVGFLDSVNRLNVALTRARQQLVILGHGGYFRRCGVPELEALYERTRVLDGRDLLRRPEQ